MATNDYYRTLGVPRDAHADRIKEAYRELAFRYHPDRSDEPRHVERMQAVNEAYAVLSDSRKRREYDTLQRSFGDSAASRFRQSYSEQDIFHGSDIQQIFEEMARSFGLRGFDEIFKGTHGPQVRSFRIRRPGFFAGGFLFAGGRFPLGQIGGRALARQLQRAARLVLGQGLGGNGPAEAGNLHDTIEVPASLAHSGGPYAYYLKARDKKLVVKIPPGIRDGQQIRLAGMGMPAPSGAGDLLLTIKLRQSLGQRLAGLLGGRGRRRP